MNAVAYARYSTDKQTENSIAYQLSKITEYCQKNNLNLIKVYTDEACTGTNTKRMGFQNMMYDAELKKFDAVVIYDISRGSRDVVDWLEFRKRMNMLGIKIYSTSQQLGDISDPNSFLTELISVGLGQHQVLDIRKKSIDGTAERAKKGLFCGGYPPLGYDIKDGKYIINETEAAAVRKIFYLYADGEGYNKIIDELNGLRGKRGKVIGKNSLSMILRNERYIGIYTWNKKQYKYMRNYAGGKENPNCIRLEGIIPRIIDDITWKKVQKRMKNNKHNAKNTAKREYLLSGLIKCSQCGGSYVGIFRKNTKGYETLYYVCGTKYRNHTCSAKNINANEIEVFVVSVIKDYIKNFNYDSYAEEILKQIENSGKSCKNEKLELADIEKKIHNCVKCISKGVYFEELQEEVDRLKLRKSELLGIILANEASAANITKEQIISRIRNSIDGINIENTDTTSIKRLLNELIEIHINKDGSCTVLVGFKNILNTEYCGSWI